MKKISILTVVGLFCSIQIYAQYFNSPFFKSGFDTKPDLSSWKVETTPAVGSETILWQQANANQPFSGIDNASMNSLFFKIGKDTKCTSILTSPEINASGKKGLVLGFYHGNMTLPAMQKIYFYLEITCDNGVTWETIFSSATDSYKGQYTKGWRYNMYYLSDNFSNRKIKLRLKLDAAQYTGTNSSFYLDGLYLSTRYQNDVIAMSSNMQRPDTRYSSYDKAFTQEEPVTLKIGNNGTNDIQTMDVSYQIDDNVPVRETFTPVKAIQMGDSAEYTFKAKVNLGSFRTSYNFKVWVDLPADLSHVNDTLKEKLQNVLTDVPYVPAFWFDKNGYINLDEDKWLTDQDYKSGVWRANPTPKPGFWFVNFKSATEECKAVLRSRPVYLKANEKYEFRFNAYSEMTTEESANDAKKNKLVIYITKDPKGLEGLTEIWRNESIDKTNGLNSLVRFTTPETGAYYFSFKCISPITASELRIRDFYFVTTPKADAKILDITAPVTSQYLFSKNEPIRISVLNNGIETIASNTLRISARLNDNPVITETIPDVIPVNGKLNYTFKGSIDLTDLSQKHNLEIWTELPDDENLLNDTIQKELVNSVAGIPYMADFSINEQGEFPIEKNLWEIINNNNDDYAFKAEKNTYGNRFTFNYGGVSTDPSVVIPTTDESLYSRPVMLNAGANYRIQYSANVQSGTGTDKSFNVKVCLYKVLGNNKTEVKVMYNDKLSSSNSLEHIADIKEDGVYVIGYHITKSTPVDYYISISNLKVTKTANNDISLDNLFFGGKYVSGYKSQPLGVRVSNPGINKIESFTLTVASPSLGTKTQTFGKTIEPLKNTYVYLDEDITLTGAKNETLTVTVTMDNDGFESNNTKTLAISYLDNATPPYSVEFIEKEGFIGLDKNKDSQTFRASQTTETVLGLPVQVYSYTLSSSAGENSDVLLSRSLNLQAGKVYKISFGSEINMNKFKPSMSVYAQNIATGIQVPITKLLNKEIYETKLQYTGYFSVPEEGTYCIGFSTLDGNIGLRVRDKLKIEEVAEKPDIKVAGIKSPVADAVFGEAETISATIKNEGNMPVSGTMFSCQVNDTILYNCITSVLEPGQEAEIPFELINMNEPGDYAVTVKAETVLDLTPENNVYTRTIKSLPIVEMQIVSKDSPVSGALGKEESIVVTVKNNGKGTMNNVPVHYSVTHLESKAVVKADETLNVAIGKDQTHQFTFAKKADMSSEGTYEIVVYTDMSGETVLSNDTIKTNVVSTHKIFDAGISAVSNPVDGLFTDKEQITVDVKNFGEVDLYNVPVFAVVTRNGEIIKEFSGDVAECKIGKTVKYTFIETADMYAYGDYIIKAYTKAGNDTNRQNDTCTVKVRSKKIDCGVTEIVNPEAQCPMGMQTISVIVKNFGEVEINNIPVRFKVGSMPQSGVVEQTLQPGESATFTFPTEYNFRSEKEYTLSAYTELETDMDRENDTVSKTINVVTGIDSEEVTGLSLYPNPAKEVIHIKAENELLKSLTLYDKGGNILSIHTGIRSNQYTLQLRELPSGVYLLTIETESGKIVRKVFKD